MDSSRVREFNAVRDRNLSQTYSQISQSSKRSEASYRDASFQLTSSQAFHKKSKAPVCVDCVNKRLVGEREVKEQTEREDQVFYSRQQLQSSRNYVDSAQQIRDRLARQSQNYNRKAEGSRLRSIKSAKQIDTHFMQVSTLREKQLQQLEEEVAFLKKQKEDSYRAQLSQQLDLEAEKKQQQKEDKLRAEPDRQLIKSYSTRQLGLKYAQDLKRQMAQDKRKRQQQKVLKNQTDFKAQELAKSKFMEYTEFKAEPKNKNNPQIFEQHKSIEEKRRIGKLETRQAGEQERRDFLLKNKQLAEEESWKSLQRSQAYASQLDGQMRAKENEMQQVKQMERSRVNKYPAFTEEVEVKESCVKPCGECYVQVSDQALSYY